MTDTGLWPAQGKLILNPTSYASGGDDLGVIGTGHAIGVNFKTDWFTRQPTGSTPTSYRTHGVEFLYQITLLEHSTNLMKLLFRGMSSDNSFYTMDNYYLGHDHDSNQEFNLLIRPVQDDGVTFDPTRPLAYMPRAVVKEVGPLIWDRQIMHFGGTFLNIVPLLDTDFDSPLLYGYYAELPSIGGSGGTGGSF